MAVTGSIDQFEEMIENYPGRTQILAEGDSWFAIPFTKHIIKQINKLGSYSILNLADSGDEAMGMMTWKQKEKVHRLLSDKDNEYDFKAFLFSGGGNDIVGPEMWHLFKPYETDMTALECFNETMLEIKLTQIEMAYRELITIRDNLKPDLPIITHTYDRAIPNGKEHKLLFLKFGPWMKPSMVKRKIPQKLHQPIVDHLMGKMRDILLGIQNDPQVSRFHVVDSQKTISKNQWGDELHPKSEGFKKIAVEKWKPVLAEVGIPLD